MAIGNPIGFVNSNLFSNSKSFGKSSVVDADYPKETLVRKSSELGKSDVTVSISPDAFAAYDAGLNRIKNSIALTMDHGAKSGVTYELRKLAQTDFETGGSADEPAIPSAIIPEDKGIDWGAVSMNLGIANGGGGIKIEDLSKVADLALADVKQQLDHAFAQAGVSNNPPVTMSFDPMGNIVIGEHPSKSKIEALFAQNAELTNDVRTAYALKEDAVQWEKAALYTTAYYQAYQTKGIAAANKLTELFLSIGDRKPELKYGHSGLELSYDGATSREYLASVASRLGLNKSATHNLG